MEFSDNMEILFLHLTYILLFIFLFQAQGMNVGISVALLEETKNRENDPKVRTFWRKKLIMQMSYKEA